MPDGTCSTHALPACRARSNPAIVARQTELLGQLARLQRRLSLILFGLIGGYAAIGVLPVAINFQLGMLRRLLF